jgi:hypothetical protein
MTDERIDRAATDEPDGTPAYAASMRPPGESVQPGGTPTATDEDIALDAAPTETSGDVERGAGYDVEAVSGDTDIYRPDR